MLTITLEEVPTFAVGDAPSSPVSVTLDPTEGSWTGVQVGSGTATLQGDTISITLPALDAAGVLVVPITLTGAGGARATAGPLQVVVEDPTSGWLTIDQARLQWADAPDDEVVFFEVLEAARTACIAFAPAVDDVPAHYRRAQLVQAKAIWAAERPTYDNRAGDEDYSISLYPLDWNVKQLLRPKPGVPVMF